MISTRVLFGLAMVAAASGCGFFAGVDWDRVGVADSHDSGPGGGNPGGGNPGGGNPGGGNPGGGDGGGTTRPICVPPKVACIAGCCDDNKDRGLPVSVSAGGGTTCAASSSGKVFCWGSNIGGTLGRGKQADSYEPVQAYNIPSGATQVAVGSGHACAVVGDLIGCWGANANAQLGFEWTAAGIPNGFEEPGRVQNLQGTPISVAVGDLHGCGLVNGTVSCWGTNGNRELASKDPNLYLSYAPLTISQIGSGIRAIAGGGTHGRWTCAILSDGGVSCWGRDSDPTKIPGIAGASLLAVGPFEACAVSGGATKCWGGPAGEGMEVPQGLPTSGVTSIAEGYDHACAVVNGEAWCWGGNAAGQLGRETSGTFEIAGKVPNLSGVESISTGFWYTCALMSNKTIKCWGDNGYGQLGNGTKDSSTKPVDVKWP